MEVKARRLLWRWRKSSRGLLTGSRVERVRGAGSCRRECSRDPRQSQEERRLDGTDSGGARKAVVPILMGQSCERSGDGVQMPGARGPEVLLQP